MQSTDQVTSAHDQHLNHQIFGISPGNRNIMQNKGHAMISKGMGHQNELRHSYNTKTSGHGFGFICLAQELG